MSGIEGKVIAITGASSGIGEATATLLAERGARLVLGARNADKLNAVAARLTESGADAIAFAIEQPSDVDVGEIVVRPTAQA